MALDLSDGGKHVRTRDGKAVRIYATDGLFPYRVHGAVQQCEYWEPVTWNEQGEWSIGVIGHRLDLIPYAPTEQWLIDVPAGQTPIVFVPTGEVRGPRKGDIALFDKSVIYVLNDCCDAPYAILKEVTPRRVP